MLLLERHIPSLFWYACFSKNSYTGHFPHPRQTQCLVFFSPVLDSIIQNLSLFGLDIQFWRALEVWKIEFLWTQKQTRHQVGMVKVSCIYAECTLKYKANFSPFVLNLSLSTDILDLFQEIIEILILSPHGIFRCEERKNL